MLLQSRAAPISDILRRLDVNELAVAEPGSTTPLQITGGETLDPMEKPAEKSVGARPVASSPMEHKGLKMVTVTRSGKVEFQDSDFKDFSRG